jgi:UPF0271 protein
MGKDAAMRDLVSWANVACGGNAGDPETMHRRVEQAVRRNLVIGALCSIAALPAGEVRYVRLHGALGNLAAIARPRGSLMQRMSSANLVDGVVSADAAPET